ncbi:MAG: class I SAM-dependent methyltransferase [Alphaproteobacteria bacterium]|nr:class I SAM-dependent methyltransferase [Alphaproteobacteria bacterium]
MVDHASGTVAPWLDAAQWRFLGGPPAEDGTRRARVGATLRLLRATLDAHATPVPPDAEDLVSAFFGWRMDLRAYGVDGLDGLAVSGRPRTGAPLVVSELGPGGPRHRFVGHGWLLLVRPLLDALQALLHGDELEVDFRLAGRHRLLPTGTVEFPDGWWPGWKDREADGLPFGEAYRTWVYPAVARALAVLPEGLRVLDLAGGDGEALALVPAPAEAWLVDRCAALLGEAATRFAGRPVHTVRADLRDDRALGELTGGPVDLVVAVGALCVNVLPEEACLRLVARLADVLVPGGRAVVSGWTPCQVDAACFEAAGLRVCNRVAPWRADAPDWRLHLYLLERPG